LGFDWGEISKIRALARVGIVTSVRLGEFKVIIWAITMALLYPPWMPPMPGGGGGFYVH